MYQPRCWQRFCIHLPLEIISIIIFLADTSTKLAFSMTSRAMQQAVFTIYETQMRMQLSRYMALDIQQNFWDLLDETHSLIIGSIAVHMIFPSVTTPSLDIASPKSLSPAWSNFFARQSYQESDNSNEVEVNGLEPVLILKKEVRTNHYHDILLKLQYRLS